MIVVAALIAVALATPPAKSPEVKGGDKGGSAESASKSDDSRKLRESPQAGDRSTSSLPTPSQPASKASESKPFGEAENQDIQRRIEIFTGVLAGVGALQLAVMFLTWVVYRRQAVEMRRQRHEMRRQRNVIHRQWTATRDSALVAEQTLRALEAEQRARVGAAKVKLRSFHPGEEIRGMLVLRNFGKSTAFRVRAEWYMEAEPTKTSWSVMGASGPDVMLYPGIDFEMPIKTSGAISVETFEAIGNGKLFIYVWGEVQYWTREDGDGNSRSANLFSFIYDPELREFLACEGCWQTEEAYRNYKPY